MTKQTINGNLIFHAEVKSYLPPVIVDQFQDDEGEENYILANGNTCLKDRYDQLWLPTKGKCNFDKKYKGENLDTRKIK